MGPVYKSAKEALNLLTSKAPADPQYRTTGTTRQQPIRQSVRNAEL